MSEFSEEIDWAEQRIKNLTNAIDLLDAKMENASSYEERINLSEQLISKNEELRDFYVKIEKETNKRLTVAGNVLKGIKGGEKYIEEINRGKRYDLELFKGKAKTGETSQSEELYNAIVLYQELSDEADKAVINVENSIKSFIDAFLNHIELVSEKYDTMLDTIEKRLERYDAKYENSGSYKEKLNLTDKSIYKSQQRVKVVKISRKEKSKSKCRNTTE